jgi:hypothetical protein
MSFSTKINKSIRHDSKEKNVGTDITQDSAYKF